MRIETIEQAVNRLAEVAEYYFKNLNYPLTYKDRFGSKKKVNRIVKHDGTDLDPCIIIDEWLIITPFVTEEKIRSILGNRDVDVIHFSIQTVVHNFGVHYYPDGSGEPPSDDIVEYKLDKPLTCVGQAIEKAIHIMLDNDMDGIGENLMHEEWAKEEVEEMT